MRAMIFEEFGGPEVLHQVDLPEPTPGPGEVTVEVAYAGINFADVLARAEGYRVESLPFRPGLEVAGRVLAVGEGVTAFAPGQEVTSFLRGGGYSEIAVAPAATTFPVPPGLGLRVAASLPSVLPTAYALLHDIARLREGDTVLVHSAAGGVGTVAGQLARLGGASAVYGVVSSFDKAPHALKSGYDQVFLTPSFDTDVMGATGGRGVDIALDPMGGENFRRTLAVTARFGRLVSFGNSGSAAPWQIGPPDVYPAGLSVSGFSLMGLAAADPQRLRQLAAAAFRAVTDGGVELPVTAEFALTDAAEAHRLVETRSTTGKLLLRT
ncbi:quinone oxidoreductase family protein [Streptomyces sp. NBC_01198]|uniref:quinone oxidoreductase family protein n=1 Tax=Streptomyces sp. NBC_01198 TaxID=2903769 RepID=UPI002E1040AD|nr:zinc-binding dehydrogenase [Streptomyces sp. NBC_01198]